MEIFLAFLAGGAIGALVHATLPGRDTRGVALAPILGAFVGGSAWMILTWAGIALDNPLIWLAAVAAPLLVTYPLVAAITRLRRTHDARERSRLKIA